MTTVVATETALRTAIQRKLHEIARVGRFFRTYYDKDGMAGAIDPATAERVKPVSILVNEVTSEFEPDPLHGRAVHQRRTDWRFELHLGFPKEVTVAFFEQDSIAPVPRVDSTDQHTYAILRLTGAEYNHPARDGSAGGTSVVLTWDASIGR